LIRVDEKHCSENKKDQRKVDVGLTKSGKKMVADVKKEHDELFAYLSNRTPAEARQLSQFLN